METLTNAVVLAYHGCSKDVANRIFSEKDTHLKPSSNLYDWLGSGIYFWEADPVRGYEWAVENYGLGDADVVGAAIHLGRCLNLMSRRDIEALAKTYDLLKNQFDSAGKELPKNGATGKSRKLDCAVIEKLHAVRKENALPSYDTVRGLFTEGGPAFLGSEIQAKTHIQICVRETRVIKGYFRVFSGHLAVSKTTEAVSSLH